MHGKPTLTFMNRHRSPLVVKNMDSFARSREKSSSSGESLQEFLGFSTLFEDISTPTWTREDVMLWKLPTPPQSPPRDELPDCEESVDLTQFGKCIQGTEIVADVKKEIPIFDSVDMDTDFSDLIDFMSSPTSIEDFSPDEEMQSLTNSLKNDFLYKEDGECVMMRGDIMWSESSSPSPVNGQQRECTLTQFWDNCALNVALQSDVLPPFPTLDKTKAAEELSYREKSVALGTDTPSDSEEEIDVVNTEEPDKRPSLPQITAEEIRVRVSAKRAAAAVVPEVQIEVKATSNCYCSTTGRPHHHHIPVDHHNYSLPPSPTRRRSPITPSRHSSPESVCREKIQATQKGGLSAQVVESALQQALQLQSVQRTHKGLGVRRGTFQKGHKRGKSGRVGKSQTVNSARQYVQVASAAAAQCGQSTVLTLGGRRRCEALNYEEDGDRRNQHNVLERNRRILLSGKFTALKYLVPTIMDQDKASKVVILNNAETHIRDLRSQEVHLVREQKALKARNEVLKKRLAELSKKW